jgi:deoxyribonuclease V
MLTIAASRDIRDPALVIVAVDVDYRENEAVAACVAFAKWTDDVAAFERVVRVPGAAAAYVPGMFYLRELPCVLAALKGVDADVVVVDGYVMLMMGMRGLGGHLHEAIHKPVVGVAKNEFRGAAAESVVRGGSKKPLFVTAAGMPAKDAAVAVRSMHGPYRIPTLLARADQLCRA